MTKHGEKVHSDIWGPATPQSLNGKEYFVSFTDDHTCWSHIEPISCKAEALTCYKAYEAWLEMQHAAKLKWSQTDCGGKYPLNYFNTHLKGCGIVCSLTVHDTPEENGMSECLNYTLLEHACTTLIAADLPKFLWAESVQHVTWLKNHTSTHALNGKTPFEMLHKEKPNLENLPKWGIQVFVL